MCSVDFNVPQHKKTYEVTDATRIVEALPTIKFVLERAHSVVLMSHLGRPDGQIVPKFSLERVVPVLEKHLG